MALDIKSKSLRIKGKININIYIKLMIEFFRLIK